MQANKEIGKIQSQTPLLIAQALELFLADLTSLSVQSAERNGDSKITPSHIKQAVTTCGGQSGFNYMGFLKEAVAKVSDLQANEAAAYTPEPVATGARRKGKAKDKG